MEDESTTYSYGAEFGTVGIKLDHRISQLIPEVMQSVRDRQDSLSSTYSNLYGRWSSLNACAFEPQYTGCGNGQWLGTASSSIGERILADLDVVRRHESQKRKAGHFSGSAERNPHTRSVLGHNCLVDDTHPVVYGARIHFGNEPTTVFAHLAGAAC